MARLNRVRLAPVLLGLLTLAMTLWLWRWADFNHSWGNDEELYLHFARGISRDPGTLFHLDPSYGRGIQRLHLLLLALPMAVFKNPQAFVVAHLLFVTVYASSAIPAWLIARGCGLGSYQALVPAVLVVLTPWSVITTSFLTESVGYGVFAWAVWGIWRAAVRPSLVNDVVAVALLALAVVARTGFLLMLPVLPTVAVLQAWRYGTGEGPPQLRLRRLPAAALRRQPVALGLSLTAVAVVALAWAGVLPGGPGRFTGSYATSLPPLNEMLGKWRSFLSRIDAGTGFLLFAAALPWIVARIAKPREPALHALAWTALLASAATLVALVGGPGDERYVMFVAFPVALTGSIALLRRELSPVMVVLGGAVALALFFTPGWRLTNATDFGYFAYPIESFMGRVVLAKLHTAVSSVDPRTTAAVLLAAGLAGMALLAWRMSWRRWLPLVIVPAALFQVTAATYAIDKHVNTVGARLGPGLSARAWVDQHVPSGEDVGIYGVSNGLTGDYNPVWREIQYWNATTRSVVTINSPLTRFPGSQVPYPFGTWDISASLDEATGKVSWDGRWPFPRYLVVPQPPLSVALDWRQVARPSYLPASLVRVARPLQARTTLAGARPDGFTDPATPAVITVYRAARPQPRCVFADLHTLQATVPQPGLALHYRVLHDNHQIAAGAVPANDLRRVYMPVAFAGKPAARFTIRTYGTVAAMGTHYGIQIGNYETLNTPCPREGG